MTKEGLENPIETAFNEATRPLRGLKETTADQIKKEMGRKLVKSPPGFLSRVPPSVRKSVANALGYES